MKRTKKQHTQRKIKTNIQTVRQEYTHRMYIYTHTHSEIQPWHSQSLLVLCLTLVHVVLLTDKNLLTRIARLKSFYFTIFYPILHPRTCVERYCEYSTRYHFLSSVLNILITLRKNKKDCITPQQKWHAVVFWKHNECQKDGEKKGILEWNLFLKHQSVVFVLSWWKNWWGGKWKIAEGRKEDVTCAWIRA